MVGWENIDFLKRVELAVEESVSPYLTLLPSIYSSSSSPMPSFEFFAALFCEDSNHINPWFVCKSLLLLWKFMDHWENNIISQLKSITELAQNGQFSHLFCRYLFV